MLPVQIYRILLHFYPAPFRKEYGSEMLSAFTGQIHAARRHGGKPAELSICFDTLLDLFLTAPKEHIHVIMQDLRYAARSLAAAPGFTVVAILSLALGIGANIAIFSLLNTVLLSSLPVRNPQELVMLTNPASDGISIGSSSGERGLLTYTEFQQQRSQSSLFSDLMASQSILDRLQARVDGAQPEEIRTRMVSGGYFSMLGVNGVIGRVFSLAERDTIGAAPFAVISNAYWRRRFGQSPGVLGKTIALRNGVFTIIGVAPANFLGETVGQPPDAWLPLSMQPVVNPARDYLRDKAGDIEKVMWLHVFGRLKPGQTIDTAQAGANVIFQQGLSAHYAGLSPEMQKEFLDQRLKLRPAATGASQLRGQFAEPLTMLLAAAGVVLLIACANLGNLLLSRVASRNREISVRLTLGASRGRLVRQLLTESLFLAALGGIAGVAAAFAMRFGLVHLVSDTIDLPLTPDLRMLGFAFGLTLLTGLLLGLLPALRAIGIDSARGIKEQGCGIAGSIAWQRVGRLIVVGQLALSLPLLVGAALFLQTLYNLQNVDLGYAKDRLIVLSVDFPGSEYAGARLPAQLDRIVANIRAVPGIRHATLTENGLFAGSDSGDEVVVEGYTRKGDKDRGSNYDHVGSKYFSALGIPMLRGREIGDRDTASSARVCVINETFAKIFFEGRDPIGVHLTQVYGKQRNTFEIVGVAKNSRVNRLRGDIEKRFYVPVTQPIFPIAGARFIVQTTGEPSGLMEPIRRAILARDPDLTITETRPLNDMVNDRMVTDRMMARLSIAFGAVALLLAAIGLYGVLSYGVTRRTKEIGIRKALGARHGDVMSMILRETGWLLAAGLASGVGLSFLGMRLVSSRLYGLAPTDPLAFSVSIAVLALVALAATSLPAYRASRVDPMVALRHD